MRTLSAIRNFFRARVEKPAACLPEYYFVWIDNEWVEVDRAIYDKHEGHKAVAAGDFWANVLSKVSIQ